MERKKYTVKLNNIEKIEQLLQETYDLANRQTNQIQEEINKISNFCPNYVSFCFYLCFTGLFAKKIRQKFLINFAFLKYCLLLQRMM